MSDNPLMIIHESIADRQQELHSVTNILASAAHKASFRASTVKVILVLLGAFVATREAFSKLLGSDAAVTIILFTLSGLLIAAVAGLESAFKWENRGAELSRLAASCQSIVRLTDSQWHKEIETAPTEHQLEAARKLIDLQDKHLTEVQEKAAALGVNITLEVRGLSEHQKNYSASWSVSPGENLGTISPELAKKPPEQIVEVLIGKSRQEIPHGFAEVYWLTGKVSKSSGFVVSDSGFMVTFLLKDVQEVLVRLYGDDDFIRAKVVKNNPNVFLSLLKLPGDQYPALEFASTNYVGAKVYRPSFSSGLVEGDIIGTGGVVRLRGGGGRDVVVEDIIKVENMPQEESMGGSPLLNAQNEVVGVIIASSPIPHILAVASNGISSAFPEIYGEFLSVA